MVHTHLACPDLVFDKISGTNPDQDAESLIQLIERKINSALVDAPADVEEFANYIFWKKTLYSSLIRGPTVESSENNNTKATTWVKSEQTSSLDFQTNETDFQPKWKWNIVSEELENNLETLHCIKLVP